MCGDVEEAIKTLFRAYDLNESGELSRQEFLKIEMRLCYDSGGIFMEEAETAKLTIADTDNSGRLDFKEFRERQLRHYSELYMSTPEVIEAIHDHVQRTFDERSKMGPRYHSGIRQVLKRIFQLYDTTGNALLSPQEWIAAQRTVAVEILDDIDSHWIDEAAFSNADSNGDGNVDLHEWLEASFQLFERSEVRMDSILTTLQRCVLALEKARSGRVKETLPIDIMVLQDEFPEFKGPGDAHKDEPTEDDREKNVDKWQCEGNVKLPTHLATAEEVIAILRLILRIPADTWVSVYYLGPGPPGTPRQVTLLRGEKPGEGNVKECLEYLSKASADPRLFVKNNRRRAANLIRQARAFLEEREGLLAKRTGQCWGIDWETTLVFGEDVPPRPGTSANALTLQLGDALIIEVPETALGGEYRYVVDIFMDGTDVLSKPVDEDVAPSKKKKKKGAGEADPMVQMSFVSLKEGRAVLFVDVGWEDQEEKLCVTHKIIQPLFKYTVARIGPIEVEVVKTVAGRGPPGNLQWWNGEKWTGKKGPKKRKR